MLKTAVGWLAVAFSMLAAPAISAEPITYNSDVAYRRLGRP